MTMYPLTTFTTLLLLFLLSPANANVEKTIFLAPYPPPPSSPSSSISPSFDDIGLDRLSPLTPILRTRLNATFQNAEIPNGSETWVLLEGLNAGQRYEVRVCWLATQPTSFTLDTFTLPETIQDPSLLSSISHFSSARLASGENVAIPQTPNPPNKPRHRRRRNADPNKNENDAVLFLRVRAAADYYTTDRALMETVPPVVADVILDPFLGNVFPRSLVPTACWGVAVAIVAVGIARWIVGEMGRVVTDGVKSDTAGKGKKRR